MRNSLLVHTLTKKQRSGKISNIAKAGSSAHKSITTPKKKSRSKSSKSTSTVNTVIYAKSNTSHRNASQYYVFPPKEHISSNYTYAKEYKQQVPKQLVFFTTAELFSSKMMKHNLLNHIHMCSFFQTHYNFTAIMYTRSPLIASVCKQHNITVVDHYQTNPHGMPLIRDLYQQSYHLIRSHFYGYINSDIVMSPSLFSLLDEVEKRIAHGEIPENV